jgi:streptogrisin C
MQRRTVVALAATVTAAGAAVAFTLPSMAGTNAGRGPASQSSGGVAPQLLAAMQRDLGVSADQAAARVKRAAWASGVAAQLRSASGDAYAGSWLGKDGTTLNIAITDAGLADRVRAAGATPKLVERSVAELDSAKRALDAEATRADRDLPGWYVDVAANQVVVQALPGDTEHAAELAEDAGIPDEAVRVVVTKSAPKPLADVIGAEPYFVNIGGGQARCSIGFAVEGGFVTAGHCGAVGTPTTDRENQRRRDAAAVRQRLRRQRAAGRRQHGGAGRCRGLPLRVHHRDLLRHHPGEEPDGQLPGGRGHRPDPDGRLRRGR